MRRPKLLFLAWNFPPVQAIASVRTWNVAKYLARLGWDVTVVTPKPGLFHHLDTPEKAKADLAKEGIRQILTDHRWRFLAPVHLTCSNQGLAWLGGGICRWIARSVGIDSGVGWIEAAERACLRLAPKDVDLILASGPPFAAFVVAERLSKKLARPYVLDYRDLWTEASDTNYGLKTGVARIEARLLKRSAAVTIVSKFWASDLDHRFKVGSKMHVVTNGYDPEELAEVKPHDFGHFAIVYAGIFYPPERVITPVLTALKDLAIKGGLGEWYFHYYGDHNHHVREEAIRLGIIDRVRLHGKVSRSEALSALRGANIAVVVSSVLDEAAVRLNSIPGKLFEIIGLGTPILLIAPPGTDVESIAVSTGVAHRFSGSEITGIKSFIEQLMLGSTLQKRNTDSFAWKGIAKTFDTHLRGQLSSSL